MRLKGLRLLLPAIAAAGFLPGTAVAASRQAFLLELEGEPLAVLPAPPTKALAAARLAGAKRAQQTFEKSAARVAPQASVLFRSQRLVNGVAFLATADEADDLGRLAGVRGCHRLALVEPSAALSVPFVGTATLWTALPEGLLGDGVRIAIVDTGIDYLHAHFGGAGSTGSNNTTVVGDVAGFPGVKVAGGWDFVGDAYNALNEETAVPAPDPDPMDCQGHGTHVAGIAAGYGVSSGATYQGPWDNSTTTRTFTIGPGMAPGAELYSLRIFGCGGSSAVLIPALEWALDPDGDGDFSDRLDVVNLSLGSPVGFEESPESLAVDRLVEAGVIVVSSAGNQGDNYFLHGLPASSPRGVAVGGSLAPRAITEDGLAAPGDTTRDTVFALTSRGPDSSGFLKPDLSAPAIAFSARVGTGTGGVTLGGTSMSAPHVAGAMALLRQQRPGWSAAELKALLMNTAEAVRGGFTGPRTGLGRNGAGRIELRRAAASRAIAFNAVEPHRVSVSFGAIAAEAPTEILRAITVRNRSEVELRFNVLIEPVTDAPGAAFFLSGASQVTVPAGGEATVQAGLRIDPPALRHSRDTTAPPTANYHWMTEEGAFLLLEPTDADGTPPLRVPLHAAVRPASAMRLQESALIIRPGDEPTSVTLARVGAPLETGAATPTDIVSLVEYFEWHHESPRAADLPFEAARCADLRHVGVRRVDSDTIAFGLSTWAPFATPNLAAFDVEIDADLDGDGDFLVSSIAWPDDPRDEFRVRITFLFNGGQSLSSQWLNRWPPYVYDTAIFNSQVLVIPVRTADVGLGPEGVPMRWRLKAAFAGGTDRLEVETTPWRDWDPSRPGLRFDPLEWQDRPGPLEVTLDPVALRAAGTLGLMVLHLHNRPGSQAEVLPLQTLLPGDSGFVVY